MGYLHIDIDETLTAKKPGSPPGDVVARMRTPLATTLILADGLGSGASAHIAATLCVSRFMELIRSGFSFRNAFSRVVETMNQVRGNHMSYAAFTVVQVLNDGIATVLTYETPPPILLNESSSSILPLRNYSVGQAVLGEADCVLTEGDALLVVSDGITQSGLGNGLVNGWTIGGVNRFIMDALAGNRSIRQLQERIHKRALELWGRKGGDDCTAVLLSCRHGNRVNLLTGPPAGKDDDNRVIDAFLSLNGEKIICGATTAKIVSRYLKKPLQVEQLDTSTVAPPAYFIDGIDLVTEGTVTLNQAYNILDEEPDRYEEVSGVTELCDYLRRADRIHFILGLASNPAADSIMFRQTGILNRHKIVPLLVDKLQKQNRVVTVEHI